MGISGARIVDGKQKKQLWKEVGIRDEHTEEDPHPVAEYLQEPKRNTKEQIILPSSEEIPGRNNSICSLDRIDKPPHYTKENIWWKNNTGDYEVETEDSKGHNHRTMSVYREHGVIPRENDRPWKQTLEEMFNRTARRIKIDDKVSDDLAIFVGLNQVPEHHHVVASDIDGGAGEALDDLKQLDNFALYDISDDYSFQDPDYVEIGDARGEIGLEPYIST